MWKRVKERWPGVFENALYDGIVQLGKAVGLGAIPTLVVGWLKGISGLALLNIFVVIFVATLFLMVFIQLRRMGTQLEQAQVVSSQTKATGAEVKLLPSEMSPRDAANSGKIVVLSRAYAQPAYAVAQQVTNRLWDRMRNSEDEKDQAIAILAHNYAFASCNHASSALSNALDGPDKDNIELLQQRLREFFDAYQRLVEWTNRLAQLFSFPLSKDPDYSAWQEKHKLFHQKLIELVAADDFSQLRKRLHGHWNDILR